MRRSKHRGDFRQALYQAALVGAQFNQNLNILLSFAQFEREGTAERIRDKSAAPKANGSVTELAKAEGMSVSYLTRALRIAFRYLRIVEQIIAGRQPATMDACKLTLSGASGSK